MMHKKKTLITVRISGKKMKKRKRLLLFDVKVLHKMFREKYASMKTGISKFAQLRPKWCVLAGTSRTHNVSVSYMKISKQ